GVRRRDFAHWSIVPEEPQAATLPCAQSVQQAIGRGVFRLQGKYALEQGLNAMGQFAPLRGGRLGPLVEEQHGPAQQDVSVSGPLLGQLLQPRLRWTGLSRGDLRARHE